MYEASRVDAAKARILLTHPFLLERWARDQGLPIAEATALLQEVLAGRATLEGSPGPSEAPRSPQKEEGGSPVAPPPRDAQERPPEGPSRAGGENAVGDGSAYYSTGDLAGQRKGGPNDPTPARRAVQEHPPLGESSVCRAVRDEKNPASGKRRLLGVLTALLRLLVPSREMRRKLIRAQGQVEFFLPSELIALHLGVPRSTLYGWIKALEEEGLLQVKTLKARVDGQVLNAGTLWAFRLGKGRKTRLSPEVFEREWRDMERDIDSGTLSYAWVKARREKGIQPSLRVLGAWATGQRVLPGQEPEVDLNLIALLPLLQENPEEARKLPALITLLAQALAKLFNDHRSRRFYAGLLWQVARGELPGWWLLNAVRRLLEDFREGFVQKPGAVLQSWLREKGGERWPKAG